MFEQEVRKKTATPQGGASKTADMVSAVLIRSELHEPEEESPSICTDDWDVQKHAHKRAPVIG